MLLVALEPESPALENLDQLVAFYKRVLSGRKCLILLDDARDEAQVESLLPPPPSAAVITSRARLTLPGVPRTDLDALEPEAARALLLSEMRDRGNSEDSAVLDRVAEACRCLPLALRAVGATLREAPGFARETYLERLSDEEKRLQALEVVNYLVQSSLSLSVAALDDALPAKKGSLMREP